MKFVKSCKNFEICLKTLKTVVHKTLRRCKILDKRFNLKLKEIFKFSKFLLNFKIFTNCIRGVP